MAKQWHKVTDKEDVTAWDNEKNNLIAVIEKKNKTWRAGLGYEDSKYFKTKSQALKYIQKRMEYNSE